MFPVVNDMSLVVYGLATLAATVGYACSRRLSIPESQTIPQDVSDSSCASAKVVSHDRKDDNAAEKSSDAVTSRIEDESKEVSPQSPSLKRKRTRDDEHEDPSKAEYPQNLELIYPPKKRSRTPSSESNAQEVLDEKLSAPTAIEAHEDPVDASENSGSPWEDSSSPATPPPITPEHSPCITSERPSTPPPNVVFGSSATMSSPIPISLQPRPVSSNAFSAFVGASSPFSTASPKPGSLKPAWSEPNLAKNRNEELEYNAEEGTSSHVLVAAATSEATEVERLTGEENEDIQQEIKGVKLFIKRGDKSFSDGIIGHLKLLCDKNTLVERLLFRREPLWQVSLNVRLHPSFHCTFDASENVLRIIVTEPLEEKDEREIVVYALKPGRSCSKQDFKEFAEAFLKSPGLKEKTKS